MTKPAAVDWPIIAGDDETMLVTFDGLAYSAGRTWKAQVRPRRDITATLLADIAVAAADDDGTQTVTLTLDNAQTRALAEHNGARWDLQMTEGGKVTTLLAGQIAVGRDVTE